MRQSKSRLAHQQSNYGKQLYVGLYQLFLCDIGVQVTGSASPAAGGYDIEFEGSHVGQPEQPHLG